ncbi:MAG: UDP-N-acetylglucosamine 2-epimerase (non-hydrolyzing) [Saprospiraceae bacterium]|nr:UDP-N-acetylglucosamine 2-epimerase (non-hydrolyzing) [Saprospiraceae bacterium]
MKILTIVGARPQFIKAAVVSRNLEKYLGIKEYILHTGQNYDNNMSSIFFEEMDIPKPHFHLNIHGGGHGVMTGKMLEGIEQKIQELNPAAVLVYGDTNSTLAGALAAKKLHKKVVHVEAGLRSFNMRMPEEINRIITDRISDVLFCPTTTAINNLKQEGFDNFHSEIVLSGDVMQDAVLFYQDKASQISHIVDNLQLQPNGFILTTIHRAENTDNVARLTAIINGLNTVHRTILPVILPLHPRTRQIIEKNGIDIHFTIIDPVGYFDMLQLIMNATLICTDSGGLQKEAYFCNKYCVTLRDETEWIELVEGGYNRLAGSESERIIEAVTDYIKTPFPPKVELYGGGLAGEIICHHLSQLIDSEVYAV